MTTLTGWLTVLNLVVLICGAIGGILVVRSSHATALQQVEERIRQALHDENELLQSQVKRLEAEVRLMKSQMKLLTDTLKRTRNLDIEVDDATVIIREGNQTVVAHLPPQDKTEAQA